MLCKQTVEHRRLVLLVQDDELLDDLRCGGARSGDLDRGGPHQILRGKIGDLTGHGGREQHGLSLLGHLVENLAHGGGKTHVEHTVALVEHDDGHAAEV